MNKILERIIEEGIRNGLNKSKIAELLGYSKSSVSDKGGVLNREPRISIIELYAEKFSPNPYKLYEIVTGKTYTEKPSGSILAELDILKKDLAGAKAEIEERKIREKEMWDDIRSKNIELQDYRERLKIAEEKLNSASQKIESRGQSGQIGEGMVKPLTASQ